MYTFSREQLGNAVHILRIFQRAVKRAKFAISAVSFFRTKQMKFYSRPLKPIVMQRIRVKKRHSHVIVFFRASEPSCLWAVKRLRKVISTRPVD